MILSAEYPQDIELSGVKYVLDKIDKTHYSFTKEDGVVYTCTIKVLSGNPQTEADISCDCTGWKYRGKCKHQEHLVSFMVPAPKKRFSASSVEKLIEEIRKSVLSGIEFEVAGSYRRGRKDQKDLDILVKGDHFSEVYKRLEEAFPTGGSAREGDKVRPAGTGGSGTGAILRWYVPINEIEEIELDFHFVKKIEEWDPKLLFFTGPKELNIYMRGKARQMGMALSDRGLFDRETGGLITVGEKEIFDKLDIKYIPPEKR